MRARRLLAVAFTAAAIWVLTSPFPTVSLADEVGPSSAPKYAYIDQSVGTSGVQLISNVTSRRFRIWSMTLQNKDATNNVQLHLRSSDCTAGAQHTPDWKLAPNSTLEQAGNSPYPLLETTVTNAQVRVCTNATRAVAVAVTYTEFDPAATTYETTGTPSSVTNVVDAFVTNSPDDRVPVDVAPEDVGAGGEFTCTAEEPCTVDLAALSDEADRIAWAYATGAGLVVFAVTGLLVRTFGRRRTLA